MKAGIKYHFSRLIVLLVALHILNVSVDVDHITANISSYSIEAYDDIDCISEFVLEKIFKDDKLIAENNTEDHHPIQKNVSKSIISFLFTVNRETIAIRSILPSAVSYQPATRKTMFEPEDHSSSDYHPPDTYCNDTI